MTADKLPEPKNLVIEGGKIRRILSPESDIPEGAEVIDISGQYVIPGLIDSHVHLDSFKNKPRTVRTQQTEDFLRLNLYGGVTSVRDMGGDLRLVMELKRAAALHEIPSPDIYYSSLVAGPQYFAETPDRVEGMFRAWPQENSPWQTKIEADTDLVQAIAEIKGIGSSGIKMYAGLDRETAARLSAEAKRQGLRVWGHAALMPAKPSELVDAGLEVFSHINLLVWEAADDLSASFLENNKNYSLEFRKSVPDISALLKKMAQAGAIIDATAVIAENINNEKQVIAFLKMAKAHNVKVCSGTDMHGLLNKDWPGLFDEIYFFVEKAGYSPWQALQAATLNGAAATGVDHDRGTIEEGMRADLVVLANNPLESIRNLESVLLTLKSGVVYKRDDL
ncbi:amidohydrolase family protein [Porticoccus sp. W117]|uniref:amidohydrolase family protein n=1 Tax=Porticoccus sp. W117 TaxID=3054777 RepID=UPI0025974403|nr:amidohydrolase family protein [Porticoccus sp. W117]MDM3870681.1 amidohydrolase family protein [Porticoccus sp. W117]